MGLYSGAHSEEGRSIVKSFVQSSAVLHLGSNK
jgi:hypothetical protein